MSVSLMQKLRSMCNSISGRLGQNLLDGIGYFVKVIGFIEEVICSSLLTQCFVMVICVIGEHDDLYRRKRFSDNVQQVNTVLTLNTASEVDVEDHYIRKTLNNK